LLFVIAENDPVNPTKGAERVRDCFATNGGFDVESCYHKGGHALPVHDQNAMEKIIDWIGKVVAASRSPLEPPRIKDCGS